MAKNVDPAFQGIGQKVYPVDFENAFCSILKGKLKNLNR
jgi:hypothetical protein